MFLVKLSWFQSSSRFYNPVVPLIPKFKISLKYSNIYNHGTNVKRKKNGRIKEMKIKIKTEKAIKKEHQTFVVIINLSD